MASIPLPALAVQPPPNVLDQESKLLGLKSMLGQQQLQQAQLAGEQQQQQQRAQMFPSQLAQQGSATTEAANTAASSGITLQQQQLQLKSQQAVQQEMLNARAATSGAAAAPADGSAAPAAGGAAKPGDTYARFIQGVQTNPDILPQDRIGVINSYNDMIAKGANASDAQLKAQQSAQSMVAQGIASVLKAAPEDQGPQWQLELNSLKRNPNPDIQQLAAQAPQQYPGPQALNVLLAHMATISDGIAYAKQQNEAPGQVATSQKAQQGADPVAQLSTPEALANPATGAAIQAKIADPKTDPADIPRLQALLPKYTTAQNAALAMKAREDAAQNAANNGTPEDAGRLLAFGLATLPDFKFRNTTAGWLDQAIEAAKRYNPNYNPVVSEGQARMAAAPSNIQRFQNIDGLIAPGMGTLDQLKSAAKGLPQGQLPALNTIADWTQASLGKGPMAQYAAAALGVSGDYGRVMGGGVATEAEQQKALDVIGAAKSPEQREAAIEQMRNSLTSMRAAAIGTNPFMAAQFPDPTKGRAQTAPAAGGSATPQTHNFSSAAWLKANPGGDINAANSAAKAQGLTVVP